MDLLNYQLIVGANRQVTVPDVTVSFKLVDSKTQKQVFQDATGSAQVNFWNYLGSLPAAKKLEVANVLVQYLIQDRMSQFSE